MANSPINTIKPSISGIYTVGQTLTCSTGTWTGDPTISYSYQWKRDITNIGTNTNSYLLISADTNNPIYCVVTATNTVGSNSAYSDLPITSTFSTAGSSTITGLSQTTVYAFTVAAVNAIGQGPSSARSINIYTPTIPLNTVAPSISGTSTVGGALTCTTGTWTSSLTITYSYQWKKGITDIGTNTNTYSPILADLGVANITCIVTATSTAGAAYSTSNTIVNITATTPLVPSIGTATATAYNTATVTFTQPASNGGAEITSYTATSSPGSITGTLSQAGSGTITVSGLTTGTAYTFTVTATNSVGTSAASAASNSITTYEAPANTIAPVVTGTATKGQTLSSTTGTWTGIPSPTFAYQWQRVTTNISGATSSTYVLVTADVGNAIRCVVTATNAVSTVTANSNSTAAVAAIVPTATTIGTVTRTSNTVVSIPFTAPTDNGGAAITSYSIISTPSIALTYSGTTSPMAVTGTFVSGTSYTFTIAAINSIGTGTASASSNSVTPFIVTAGSALFTTVGLVAGGWVCPAGVTSICVVVVGSGGVGGSGGLNRWGGGGGGGGLAYANNITVIPGTSYPVYVAGAGTTSYFSTNTYLFATSGSTGVTGATATGGGGGGAAGYIGNGGNGAGAIGSTGTYYAGGAGGTGGGTVVGRVSFSGGAGGRGSASYLAYGGGAAGVGGGGGGGGGGTAATSGGGGVGVAAPSGTLVNGNGAPSCPANGTTAGVGGGGSGGAPGSKGQNSTSAGGLYGGGGGGNNNANVIATGAVRIIWGAGKAFPNTLTT